MTDSYNGLWHIHKCQKTCSSSSQLQEMCPDMYLDESSVAMTVIFGHYNLSCLDSSDRAPKAFT